MFFCSPVSLYDGLSPLWSQVCEDGGRLEGLNIKGLAALTADTVIHNIHNRLAERHAGTKQLLISAETVQLFPGAFYLLCPLLLFQCAVVLVQWVFSHIVNVIHIILLKMEHQSTCVLFTKYIICSRDASSGITMVYVSHFLLPVPLLLVVSVQLYFSGGRKEELFCFLGK